MTRDELLVFVRQASEWVEASVAPDGAPQAAVVGVVVTDTLELFFDTLDSTRKAQNLRREPRMAFVMWHGAATVQYEGVADVPTGDDLARLQREYFARFPEGPGRAQWPGIMYVRVRPTWIRHTDFAGDAPRVSEWSAGAGR